MKNATKKTKRLTKANVRELTLAHEACTAAAKSLKTRLSDQAIDLAPGVYGVVVSLTIDADLVQGDPTHKRSCKLSDGDFIVILAEMLGDKKFCELFAKVVVRRRYWLRSKKNRDAFASVKKRINGLIDKQRCRARLYHTTPVSARTDRDATVTLNGDVTVSHTTPGTAA